MRIGRHHRTGGGQGGQKDKGNRAQDWCARRGDMGAYHGHRECGHDKEKSNWVKVGGETCKANAKQANYIDD